MPKISLPDGSVRSFDQPVTVAEVAASIGPGLAKAALAGRVDGKLVDTAYPMSTRRRCRDRHGQGRRRARDHPSLDGASARACRERAFSRSAGDDRPGDRGRLLLRLLVQAAVHARRSRRDREAHGRDREARPPGRAAGHAARRSREVLPRHGREVQGRDHRVDSRGRGDLALSARATSSICAAARTCPPPASSRSSS